MPGEKAVMVSDPIGEVVPSADRELRLPRAAAAGAVGLGVLVLAGWVLDVEGLKRVAPGLASMKANSAIAFIGAGVSLWLQGAPGWTERRSGIAHGMGLAVALLGLLTVGQDLAGWELGIDQALFTDPADPASPGRMAPAGAIAFAALGISLALSPSGRLLWLRELLSTAAGLIAFTGLVGYAYEARSLYGWARHFTPMALHTALGVIVLAVGVLFVQTGRGIAAIIGSKGLGSAIARWLLPAAIGVPLVLGWLRLWGQRAGLFGTEFGVSLSVLCTIAIVASLVLWTAKRLNRADSERRAVELERIRAREAAQQQSALLRSILESLGDGVVAADERGKFMIFNAAAEQILGRGPVDADPDMWTEHYGAILPDGVTPCPADYHPLARALQGESVGNVEMRIRSGTVRRDVWIRVSGRPVRDEGGAVVAGVIAFSDVSEFKRGEQEIRELNAELQRRAAELESANHELESFSYSVSHDLRAPLRAIDGFSQALLEDCHDRLDERGRDYLGRVRAGAQRMAQLIDALLQLSRITRAEMSDDRVDLAVLAREIASELRRSEPARVAEFRIAERAVATGSAQLLRAALDNLLRNAWKFTSKCPSAVIEFGAVRKGGEVVFFVRDNGVGFDMGHAGKLFGAFQRLHARGEFEGTGVGLATVARIVRRHGGRIWAEAEVDRGATFFFTLANKEQV